MQFARCFCSDNRKYYLLFFTIFLFFVGSCKKEQPTSPEIPELTEPVLLVVNSLGETLSLIYLNDGKVDNNILTLGLWTNHIVINSAENIAYVVNSGENNVQVINLASLTDVCMIDVGIGQNPYRMAIIDTLGFVTNFLTNTVSVINLNEDCVVDTIPVGIAPEGILVHRNKVYVTNTGYSYGTYAQGTVSVIDINTRQVEATINVPTNPQEIASDPVGNLHIVCTGDYTSGAAGKIVVIDTDTRCIIDTVLLGGSPCGVVFTSEEIAYVVGYWGGLMSYKWTDGTVLHNVDNPIINKDGFMSILIDTIADNLYICNFEKDCILSVSLSDESIKETYEVGDGPVSIALRR